ncbi:hypothetical protein A9Q97_04340 [Rhodospirillales bacterium 47_12_T64]|nr:hypothetical protein A9Q97_04340 [Rhodospirillales bacterium 47_12_T64]
MFLTYWFCISEKLVTKPSLLAAETKKNKALDIRHTKAKIYSGPLVVTRQLLGKAREPSS